MVDYEEIIKFSPFVLNHLITLKETHDYYLKKFIDNETEISYSQYYMFMLLYFEPGVNQSDIAKACFMNRSGVSRAFTDFEKKGLIERKINPDNKREYITTLTEKGLKTAKFLEKKEIQWDEMICRQLDLSRDDLLEILSKLSMKSLNFNREKF
ncbi:MarR family winged helix-turn-helix transcriptional regulator [Methanobrevibacter sp.]|uniref:MarR family winged helix-turn-helix transcriptional regulator n=1 Tax=Methanobrevibacter sp. TaxID=66852 RepID=UPI002E784F7E|nr:MarR family transcriptional regulator [Methanobrevibacter sp.]MEE0024681.1 MarR family transcriptional regulator [Methanobrevibacter sp.]